MDYNKKEDLEDILLKVKFNKEINNLFEAIKVGDLLPEIEEKIERSDSMLIDILLDSSENRDNIFIKLGAKNIEDLNIKMAEDRIFKRITRILAEKELKWEFRQNNIADKVIRGYLLQLSIYK